MIKVDLRRGCCTRLVVRKSSSEFGVVVRHVDSYAQCTEDEEGRQTIENGIVCLRHYHSWVLSLTRSHGDVVWAGDGEAGLNKTLQETKETSEAAVVIQWFERPGVFPAGVS